MKGWQWSVFGSVDGEAAAASLVTGLTHRLGWTAPELFAVYLEHGMVRLDACGVMMVGNEPTRGIEANRILFERTSGYPNGPGQVWGMPVWKFARRGGQTK